MADGYILTKGAVQTFLQELNNILNQKQSELIIVEREDKPEGYNLSDCKAELGIKHHKIRPRTPEHNGKVERSHRNDNERFYSYLKFYSLEDLRKQGAAYLKRSNRIPMAVLGYLTPKEKRAELEKA